MTTYYTLEWYLKNNKNLKNFYMYFKNGETLFLTIGEFRYEGDYDRCLFYQKSGCPPRTVVDNTVIPNIFKDMTNFFIPTYYTLKWYLKNNKNLKNFYMYFKNGKFLFLTIDEFTEDRAYDRCLFYQNSRCIPRTVVDNTVTPNIF